MNPYRAWILALSLTGFLIGFIVWMIGKGTSDEIHFFTDGTEGLTEMASGASLMQLSAISFVLWLAVSAIVWKAPNSADSSDNPIDIDSTSRD
jgi:hypothetical protein